jgi:hypothetical protein
MGRKLTRLEWVESGPSVPPIEFAANPWAGCCSSRLLALPARVAAPSRPRLLELLDRVLSAQQLPVDDCACGALAIRYGTRRKIRPAHLGERTLTIMRSCSCAASLDRFQQLERLLNLARRFPEMFHGLIVAPPRGDLPAAFR